jgi:prolyl-tRNA synthetase
MPKDKDDEKLSKDSLDIGITVKKAEDFSEWYQQVIIKSEMIDYGPVSGCMIIRPYAYEIWEKVVKFLDKEIKGMGVQNAYFPMLIPEHLFTKEKEHVEGFNPEVAWVTQAGDTKLDERLAIRPTSETIMYDSYKKWVRSWRDLPLRLNQWNNIVRWEFKHPVPFLRTREFLWQEGHTAFATKEEAKKEVYEILELYKRVYEELYAVAVLKGIKSGNEKFAGALYTTSVEAWFPNGKAIQGATSHLLGQNFSKSFDITFLDKDGNKSYVWQNSWGLSTRSIGIMLAIHGDDKGLIIPPKIAPIQIVIIPILFDDTKDDVMKRCDELKNELESHHLSVFIDDRNYKPGWKFNHWELKGVPLRIEIGPRDLQNKQAIIARRDTAEKLIVKINEVPETAKNLLDDMQRSLLSKSRKMLEDSIVETDNYEEFKRFIDEKKIVMTPFCDNKECEDQIKADTGAKTLNMPLGQDEKQLSKNKIKCISCTGPAKALFYFGKSY